MNQRDEALMREAVTALSAMVHAADRVAAAWGALADSTPLEHAYPTGWPDFDEVALAIRAWRDSAKQGAP